MQFYGRVDPAQRFRDGAISGGRAWMYMRVAIPEPGRWTWLLIDTAATTSVLQPRDAAEILGSAFWDIDFSRDPRRIQSVGVGGVVSRVVRQALLEILSSEDELFRLNLPILIAEPVPSIPSDAGNWRLPSLLGRDFLRHFRLELSYGDAPQVLLETL